jgi:hypothetical protein
MSPNLADRFAHPSTGYGVLDLAWRRIRRQAGTARSAIRPAAAPLATAASPLLLSGPRLRLPSGQSRIRPCLRAGDPR